MRFSAFEFVLCISSREAKVWKGCKIHGVQFSASFPVWVHLHDISVLLCRQSVHIQWQQSSKRIRLGVYAFHIGQNQRYFNKIYKIFSYLKSSLLNSKAVLQHPRRVKNCMWRKMARKNERFSAFLYERRLVPEYGWNCGWNALSEAYNARSFWSILEWVTLGTLYETTLQLTYAVSCHSPVTALLRHFWYLQQRVHMVWITA